MECNKKLNLLLTLIFTFAKCEDDPKIVFDSISKWKNLTEPIIYSDREYLSYYSERGEGLHASCSAPYPISWDLNHYGSINPASVLKIGDPERSFNPDKFTINLFLNTTDSLVSSFVIRCSSPDNLKSDRFGLYIKGNGNETLLGSKHKVIVPPHTIFIPCRTTNPAEPVFLFKLNGTEEILLKEVVHTRWVGFYRANHVEFEEGVYICRQGSSEVRIEVKDKNETVNFYPKMNQRKFSDESISVGCSSELEENIELKFDFKEKLNIKYVKNTTWEKDVVITPIKKTEGKVTCLKEGVLVKQWTFEFVKAPELLFDDNLNEMHCDSEEGDEVEAKSFRCSSDISCSNYQRCWYNVDELTCDSLLQVDSDNKRTECSPLPGKVKDCLKLHNTSWSGLAQCKVNGVIRNWKYFTALNHQKYTDWMKVNKKELLKMEKVNENEYLCTGVRFLFGNSLAFELDYVDNSTELLQGQGENGKVTHEHPRIQGFQVVSSLELTNPENVKSVRCVASFWNSKDVLKTPPFYLFKKSTILSWMDSVFNAIATVLI